MHNALNAWADRLQHTTLPALPSSSDRLAQLSADEEVSMWNLAKIVERDPGLTISLLRRVNDSNNKKRLRTEVTTVEHGLMMLGMGQIRTLPGSVPLIDKVGEPQGRQRAMQLIARSYHAAHQARELALLRKDMEPDEIFLAALLHDLGETLLWLYAPAKMKQLEELTARQRIKPEEAQYVALGYGLNHLTLALARHWGLPDLMQESLKAESAQKPRIYGVMLAVQLARLAERGWYRPEVTALLEQIGEYIGLDFGATAARVHRFAAEAAQATACYRALPAAVLLLHPSRSEAAPGWKPEPPAEEAPPAETSPPAQPPRAQPVAAENDDAAFCLSPQLHILRQSLQELEAGIRQRSLTLQNILSLTMDGLHDGIGLNRVVFALLTQERHQLRARAIAGANTDPLFSRFVIELNGAHLFTRMMEKPQALWLNEENRTKFWPLVPKPFQHIIRTDSFYVLSLFVRNKPIGLLYADRHAASCALDARAYHRFKQLGLLAAKALNSVAETVE